MPKNSEVLFPYRQVIALLRRAHTRYIFPTLIIPIILNFLLKSKNLMISPKSHSTITLTELLSKLYCSISVLGPPGEMVPAGVWSQRVGGSTINIHALISWGKCIPFQFLEKIGIYQHACIVFFSPLHTKTNR